MVKQKIKGEARVNHSVKLSKSEWEKLQVLADKMGIDSSKCIRHLIHTGGAIDSDFLRDRKDLLMQYAKIGTNINQIAHMVNSNKKITQEQLEDVKAELAELNQITRGVLERWPLQN